MHWKRFAASITNGGMVLNQDFKEFIQSLNDNDTRDSHLEGDCHVLVTNFNDVQAFLSFAKGLRS